MGMFGGGPIPSLHLHLSSSSWQSGVVSMGLSLAGLSFPPSTSIPPRSLPRSLFALSLLSLSNCCSLLSPTPAMPDRLPGVLSLECGCFGCDIVLPSGQRYALRLWCALGLTIVRQLLGDVVGVDFPLFLLLPSCSPRRAPRRLEGGERGAGPTVQS